MVSIISEYYYFYLLVQIPDIFPKRGMKTGYVLSPPHTNIYQAENFKIENFWEGCSVPIYKRYFGKHSSYNIYSKEMLDKIIKLYKTFNCQHKSLEGHNRINFQFE